MERLNDIMNRMPQHPQRRRRTTDPRLSQQPTGQPRRPDQPQPAPDEAPPARVRHPLREQIARQGQPSTPPPAPIPQSRPNTYNPLLRNRGAQRDVSRPPSPRQRPGFTIDADAQPAYRQRPYATREPQHSTAGSYYPVDAYSSTPQADVTEEWEDDDTAMRYGDWEMDASEVEAYEHVEAPQVSRVERAFSVRELPETRSYPAPAELQVPSLLLPSPHAPTQEVHPYQRHTQPLNPAVQLSRDVSGEPPPPRTTRSTRQLVSPQQAAQNIPAPYITPTSPCPICKGAGYLRADVPYGHPNFGKPIACECKEAERREKRRQQLESISNLSDLKDKNFKNFHPNVSRATQIAYQIAMEYAQDPQGWLVLIGRTGCGKTHLAAAIANQCLAGGSLVLFSPVIDLLDHLRATFTPTATEVYDQLFAKMREAAVLVLDDLGTQQSSPWANEKLFQLLNYRYNARIPTVITTNNLGLQGIEERIRSRMTDTSLVITVTFDGAQDYRPRNPRRTH